MIASGTNADRILELRVDPATGRQVLIAEGREDRPTDLPQELNSAPQADVAHSNCPFCPGNEDQTPPELISCLDATGRWRVRVVPNKYPALRQSSPAALSAVPPLASAPAQGMHEVFVESPRHVADWQSLTADEVVEILTVYIDRLGYAYRESEAALIFKNVGRAAGASLSHIHSQLTAFPQVPATLATEFEVAKTYHKSQGQCLYCRILQIEEENPVRFVLKNEHFAAVCAYAGRQPYETWILPREHSADFCRTATNRLTALAEIFLKLLGRVASRLNLPAYNLVLHTAPPSMHHAKSFHWHWELIPRVTSLAGFEWGTGMHINPLAPERAAQNLRNS